MQSQALGLAEAAYEASIEYAREREAFGQKIGQFQGLAFKLADMKTRIEAARLLVYQAALKKEQAKKTDERFTLEASGSAGGDALHFPLRAAGLFAWRGV